jgi:CheY-like chemotaxis protein
VSARNLLIVEDEPEWCGIYSRAAARQGMPAVQVAETFGQASALIDEMQFAVAVIDIGLDVSDDRNIDGLRVMDKIRSVKDETSIVVVTGRTGADVLPISRDSLMRYQAQTILGKVEITPGGIDEALKTGLEDFEKKNSLVATPAHAVLRGDLDGLRWDDQMLRETKVRDGARGLYELLDRLVSGFLPLVPEKPGGAVAVDEAARVMYGRYWSRATGAPVMICFGAVPHAAAAVAKAQSGQPLLGRYDVGAILGECSVHGAAGAVFALTGVPRSGFASV